MEARPHSSQQEAESASGSAAHLQLLVDTGLLLARERDPAVIVQSALDAGLKLCGAAFGLFLYNNISTDGETYPLYKIAGGLAAPPEGLPLPRPADIFPDGLGKSDVLRATHSTQDGHGPSVTVFKDLLPGNMSVGSYLAVPVCSRGDELLGAILYGHPAANVFNRGCELLVATVAAQSAVSLDNARLTQNLAREIGYADGARQLHREAADRLTEVFEATTDAVFLLDRSWRFTYLNRRAMELIAGGRELVGQNIWQAFPGAVGTASDEHYHRVMENGGSTEFTQYFPPLSLWCYVRAYGTADGVAVFFQDTTKTVESERERRETERRLRQALDAGQLGTWTWDKDTDLLDLDERAAEIFGVPPHQQVTRTEMRDRVVFHDDLGVTPRSLRESLERGGTYQAEYRLAAPDGQHRWVSARGLATFSEDRSEMTGMIGTVQDITARKTQEAALRQSEKLAATGRLAATIAHEINNPLEAVTNLIYLCKTDPTVPTEIQRLLDIADSELARVAQIAQQTLGFYRDTSQPSDINLTDLLSAVVDLFSRKLQGRSVKCELDAKEELRIFGLQGEVRQVFSNLLVNAIDASTQGTIRVRARSQKRSGVEGVSVLISDPGSGISPAIRGRLFAPFFTTKQSIGTGLGLWVTRGIVEKAGGAITFRSRTETPSGTVFRVFLPCKNEGFALFSSPNSTVLQ